MSRQGVPMDRAIRGSTILFSEMTPPPSEEGEFNDWYDREHIPLRMACPGFLSAQRYLAPHSRNYLAVYEMGDPGDLRTPQYAKVKGEPSALTRRMLGAVSGFTRYIASEPGSEAAREAAALEADWLMALFLRVPPAARDAVAAWSIGVRPAVLPPAARVRLVRRLAIGDGEPGDWTDLVLFYLDGEGIAPDSVEPPAAVAGVATHSLLFARHGARQVAGE